MGTYFEVESWLLLGGWGRSKGVTGTHFGAAVDTLWSMSASMWVFQQVVVVQTGVRLRLVGKLPGFGTTAQNNAVQFGWTTKERSGAIFTAIAVQLRFSFGLGDQRSERICLEEHVPGKLMFPNGGTKTGVT